MDTGLCDRTMTAIIDNRVRVELGSNLYDEALNFASLKARKPAQYSNKYDPLSDEFWPHFIGALGEVAFGYCYNTKPNYDLTYGGDPGYDFRNLRDWPGKTVEVKTRDCERYRNPELLVRINYAKADIFVLAEIYRSVPHVVYLVGWCTHNTLIGRQPEHIGHNLNFRVPRHELTEFNFIKA